MSRASDLKDLEEWADSMDCGWRMDQSEEKPCVRCKKPCKGRNSSGESAVCYTCYHNVGLCSSAIMCGKPVGHTPKDAAKDALKRSARHADAAPQDRPETVLMPKQGHGQGKGSKALESQDSGNGGAE